jgi:hypothetical protein
MLTTRTSPIRYQTCLWKLDCAIAFGHAIVLLEPCFNRSKMASGDADGVVPFPPAAYLMVAGGQET